MLYFLGLCLYQLSWSHTTTSYINPKPKTQITGHKKTMKKRHEFEFDVVDLIYDLRDQSTRIM